MPSEFSTSAKNINYMNNEMPQESLMLREALAEREDMLQGEMVPKEKHGGHKMSTGAYG